jgi:transposase-like protein
MSRISWRAVDGECEVLEILVQPQRDKAAALRLLRKLLRRQGFVPAVIVKMQGFKSAKSARRFALVHAAVGGAGRHSTVVCKKKARLMGVFGVP